jgi:hypothetical protein
MQTHFNILSDGHGHWIIETTFRGKTITGITNDSRAVDAARDGKKSAINWLIKNVRDQYRSRYYPATLKILQKRYQNNLVD